jgi:hypothetical protein
MSLRAIAQKPEVTAVEGTKKGILQPGAERRWIGRRIKWPHGADLFFGFNRARASVRAGCRSFAAVVFAKRRDAKGHWQRVPIRVAYFGTSRKAKDVALAWWCAEQASLAVSSKPNLTAHVAVRRGGLFAPFPVLVVPKPAPQPSISTPAPVPVPDEVEELVAASTEEASVLENAAVTTTDQLAVLDEEVHVEPLSWSGRLACWLSWVWRRAYSLGCGAQFSARSVDGAEAQSREQLL